MGPVGRDGTGIPPCDGDQRHGAVGSMSLVLPQGPEIKDFQKQAVLFTVCFLGGNGGGALFCHKRVSGPQEPQISSFTKREHGVLRREGDSLRPHSYLWDKQPWKL